MGRLSKETEEVLRGAGWLPGRRVDVERWRSLLEADGFTMHDAAADFLSQYGGLEVRIGGAGVSSAREPFSFDPLVALGEQDRFSEWSEDLGHELFPIGDLDHKRFFLGIDERGEIFLVADWLARFGGTEEALDGLVLGIAPEAVFG